MNNQHLQTDVRRRRRSLAAAAVLGLGFATGGVAAASSDTTAPTGDTAAAGETDYQWTPNADLLAGAEGEVNLVSWAGYVEDGSTDPRVDWVTPFEEITGCAVNNQLGGSSDEMVALMQSGEYDAVSASGDATERLIAGGEVGPLDVSQMTSYEQIFDDLKLQQWNSVDGEPYGMPHGRGANLLVWNTEAFADGAPDSWSVMFEGGTAADGAVSVYDNAIYIADAALYLMATQPDLGITNPYALDETQFAAAIELLGQQEALVGQYWAAYTRPADRPRRRHRARRHDVAGDRQPRPGQWGDDRRRQARRGGDRMVGHLDGLDPGGEPQLRVAVERLDHVAMGQRPSCRVVRRGAVEPRVVRPHRQPGSLLDLPRRGDRVLGGRVVLDDSDRGVHRRTHRRHLRPLLRVDQRLERTPQLIWAGFCAKP